MTKTALLDKLSTMLDKALQERMWGNMEIEIRDGVPTVLRKMTTERLTNSRETTHGGYASNDR
jgi:hypothetical protein